MITHFKLHTRLSKVHSKHHRALVETEDGSKRNFDIRLRKDGWYIVLETGDDGPFTTVYQAFDVLNKWYVRPDEISPKVAPIYITESLDGIAPALVSSNPVEIWLGDLQPGDVYEHAGTLYRAESISDARHGFIVTNTRLSDGWVCRSHSLYMSKTVTLIRRS